MGSPINVSPAGSVGSGPTQAPRMTYRWDASIVGNANAGEVVAIYGNHMKSGDSATDKARRAATVNAIRDNANGLAANYQFLYGGDMNMQSSNEAEYQTLVGSAANNRGQFVDPIKTPGTWNNSSAFRFVHTQDPSGAGGMDDRFDQILFQIPQFLGERDVVDVRIDQSPYAGVEPVDVGFAPFPHLIDGR